MLASVASSSVFTILLQQVAAPVADRRLAWDEVLHHLIRFPPAATPRQSKREELEERYLRLEGELSNYRYP